MATTGCLPLSDMCSWLSILSRIGPISPLKWAEGNVQRLDVPERSQRAQILLGVNLYGIDYTADRAQPIKSLDAKRLLVEKGATLQWHADARESFFTYEDDQHQLHTVYFPSKTVRNEDVA